MAGIFCSRSSCGESIGSCLNDRLRECGSDLLDLRDDDFALIIDAVEVCTPVTSSELVDDGLIEPDDRASFWTGFSISAPSSASSGIKKRKKPE